MTSEENIKNSERVSGVNETMVTFALIQGKAWVFLITPLRIWKWNIGRN